MIRNSVILIIIIIIAIFIVLLVLSSNNQKCINCEASENDTTINQSNKLNSAKIETINEEIFRKNLDTGDYILIDIRTFEEYNSGHIKNSLNIDFYQEDFTLKISQLDRTKKYLIYCRSGNRTRTALETFKSLGFLEVYDLQGGISAWTSSLEI